MGRVKGGEKGGVIGRGLRVGNEGMVKGGEKGGGLRVGKKGEGDHGWGKEGRVMGGKRRVMDDEKGEGYR